MAYLQCLHQVWLNGVLHQYCESTANTDVVCCNGVTLLACRHDHRTKTLPHILQAGCKSQNSHTLASNSDIVAGDALMTLLSRGLADGDLAQETVVHVNDTVPGDGLGVNVKAGKACNFLRGEVVGVSLVNAKLLQTLEHERSELALALLGGD